MTRKTMTNLTTLLKSSVVMLVPAVMVAAPAMAQDAAVVVVETEAPAPATPDLTGSPLTAQTLVDISKIDQDGNGTLDYGEMRAVWTELTEDEYVLLDSSGDGFIDDNELAAAYENQLLDFDQEASVESATGGN